ncbi:hypothetical protein SpCBS45565_g02727 [Spizellomyces sp. 'palustris']|nr:hypothetical protein SpCBS45565_g02727 [Spizellomyces sp. 'palustris']
MTSTSAAFWFPVLYAVAIGALFSAFIKWNRVKQKAADQDAQWDGYFPENTEKIIYNELAEMHSPEDPAGYKLLTTSLMKRALTDVRRILKIREEKPPLQQMVRSGMMGEDLLEKLLRAEAELDAEVQEVMEDAELYKPGWSKTIFQEATQLVQIQMQREQALEAQRLAQEQTLRDAGIPEDETAETPEDDGSPKETDEERRQRIADELLREEEAEKKKAAKAAKGGTPKGSKTKRKSK